MQRLWVTGYRSYELNTFGDKDPKITVIKYALKNFFIALLQDAQLDWVITGPNLGVEQWAGEVAISLRNDYSLRTAIIAPYEEFASRWNENNQARLTDLRQQADFFASTSNSPYRSPRQLRNYQNFMLQHTDRALMIYDLEHPSKSKYDFSAIKRFRNKHQDYQLNLIDFYDLQDAAEEYEENHHLPRH